MKASTPRWLPKPIIQTEVDPTLKALAPRWLPLTQTKADPLWVSSTRSPALSKRLDDNKSSDQQQSSDQQPSDQNSDIELLRRVQALKTLQWKLADAINLLDHRMEEATEKRSAGRESIIESLQVSRGAKRRVAALCFEKREKKPCASRARTKSRDIRALFSKIDVTVTSLSIKGGTAIVRFGRKYDCDKVLRDGRTEWCIGTKTFMLRGLGG